jgi:small-conductance mechanosensitive channel
MCSKKIKRKTMQQILKEQIEDSRQLLKKEIEQRMTLEKDIRLKNQKVENILEGLQDISNVMSEIIQRE